MSKEEKKDGIPEEICLFWIMDHLCGIDIREVQEISIQSHITKLHQVEDFIRGVANLRGQIVTIIDLRRRFDLPPMEKDPPYQILIVDFRDEKIGLLVDQVETVIPVDPALFDTNMASISGIQRTFYRGVYKQKESLVALINLNGIFAADAVEKVAVEKS